MKENIIKTLASVQREGIEKLISFLGADSDFFTAPASVANHNCFEGGLAKHSWTVYELLKEKNERYKTSLPEETVILCGLLHDLCKVGFYEKGFKWVKNDEDKWEKKEVWLIKDQFPVGHGEKSVMMAQRFVQLTDEETAMIRWHMGGFDPAANTAQAYGYAYRDAIKLWPHLCLLQCADVEATFMIEALDKKT